MKSWSDQPPSSGVVRLTRGSGSLAPEQGASLPNQPSGPWAGPLPGNMQTPSPTGAPPPGRESNTSRPLAGGEFGEPPPKYEIARPAIPLSRFGSATGLSLKLRFLVALALLSMAPAFLLVLLYQQANQTSQMQSGQQTLTTAAQADSNTLTQEMANFQAYLAQLGSQDSIAQASRGSQSAIQPAERLLSAASLSTQAALAWVVLSGSDQIVAASPPSSEGHPLGAATTILTNPRPLEAFVQAQRKAPVPKPGGETTLAVVSGQDNGMTDKVWIATLAFVSPTAPTQSGVVLAVFSLPAIVRTYLSALPSDPNSYAGVFDTKGAILGVAGNKNLAKLVGQQLAIAPLRDTVRALATGQSNALTYNDPTTGGAQEMVAGVMDKDLGMVFLVVAPPGDLAPPATGLLQGRNVPLIFLSIIVVTTLVATWVALPIVRPIRRATREILASTSDVRLLAEQARQIAKDQRLGTDILEGAAKGLDMRRRAIGRDAGLIVNSSTAAAARVAQMAQVINEMPEPFQAPLRVLTREIYQELQTTHQLASGISSGLESDPVQRRLGNVMEGAAEISEQFDQASQQLQNGATRLEHAAETLQ